MGSTAGGGGVLAVVDERIDAAVRDRFEVVAPASVPLIRAVVPERFVLGFTTKHASAVEGAAGAFLDLSHGPTSGSVAQDRGSGARARVGEALASLSRVPPPAIVSPKQVHGVRVVGTAEYVGEPEPTPCDGLTIQPGLDDGLAALLVFADCVPVALLGEVDGALVHGGWRGLLGGVVQQGAAAMTAPPGLAVIGPSIGPCCYEVSEELAAVFARRFGDVVLNGPRRLDLWEVATLAAGEVGVPRERVSNPRLCTVCNQDLFFSYRAQGEASGRHGAVLWSPATGTGVTS